jgi:stearoyl-CoA desaturase (delta-9 desaturase)
MAVEVLEESATVAQSGQRPQAGTAKRAHWTTITGDRQLPVLGRETQAGSVSWVTSIFMGLFHVGAIAALFMFTWKALACAVVLYALAINVGIGMGYHRLLTHRGYKVPRWLEYAIAICGTLALEGGPIFWVATHRVHHQHSDQPGDPHSPTEGTFWAHMGWILSGQSLHTETAILARYAPDLSRDRFYLWLSKYHWIPLTTAG